MIQDPDTLVSIVISNLTREASSAIEETDPASLLSDKETAFIANSVIGKLGLKERISLHSGIWNHEVAELSRSMAKDAVASAIKRIANKAR